jgi:ABC-type branched-subunit amino acid transport system substrate-binding protein
MNRRQLLGSGLIVSTALVLPVLAATKPDKRPVALLLPLTGTRAALGLSMHKAALLAENTPGALIALDTGGTGAGAAQAAAAAIKQGAAMILGPLSMDEVPAVAQTVLGRIPVVAFTNDAALRSDGMFVFGITPRQVTGSILRYARGRGIKSVAVIDDGSAWSAAAAAEAGRLQSEIGIDVRTLEVRPGQPLPPSGEAPDAVLLPGSGEAVLAAARNLKDSGIQLLGTFQGLDHRPSALEALDGAWLASPDPTAFGDFAAAYQARNGGDPGAIAALAYDAAGIVKKLRAANTLGREGLLDASGFQGVTGPLRFRTDGSVARDLSILVATRNGYEPVAVSRGA